MAKVVTVGVHILDVLGRHVERIPEGQGIDLIEEIRLTVAGTAAGSAVDLAKLGADVTTIGAIGHDDAGNFIIDTMNRYGINTESIVRKDGVQTSTTILPIRPNGERPAMHVLGTNAELSKDDMNWDVLKAADYVHFGGTYLLPKLDGAPTAEILQFAQENGAVTTLDMLAVPQDDMIGTLAPSLPYLDYLIPGVEEAAMIAGIPEENTDELIDYYLDKGVKHVVFTMGEKGSVIGSRELDAPIRIPAFDVPVVDSTGCGDAYCAGFIVGLTHGWDLEKCGLFASAASGLVITGLGSDAGIVNFDETLKMVETHPRHPIS
ncbi:MAG: sugar kinase [Chloroflexota bacterium]